MGPAFVQRLLASFMNLLFVIIFSFIVSLPCHAEDEVVHVVHGGASVNAKLTKLRMQNDLIKSARENEKYGEMIARATHYDMAYQKDRDEYILMNGFGVLWVTSHSRLPEELPIKNLRVRIENIGSIGLEPIYSVKSIEADNLVARVFGRNRNDSIYMIPLFDEVRGATLIADYALNRTDFILGDLENEFPADIGSPFKMPAVIVNPDRKIFNVMLEREYPIVRNLVAGADTPNPTFKRETAQKRVAP